MLTAFWLKNLNFALELSTSTALILAAFLLFDTWTVKKELKTGLQGAGYILLALYFALLASKLTFSGSDYFLLIVKDLGLAVLLGGLFIDRLDPVPKLAVIASFVPLNLLSPVLFLLISIFYWLKATKGYEKSLKWVAASFTLMTISDLVGSLAFLKNSNFLVWRSFYDQYSLGFYLENFFLLVAVVVLFLWALGYLRFRLVSQMFLYFSLGGLVLFVVTTFTFTGFLLGNLQTSVNQNLTISGKNFQYSLSSLEDKALITARAVAANNSIKNSLAAGNRSAIYQQVTDFFFPTKGDSLVVTDNQGLVIANSLDADQFGDSISGKAVITRALAGFDGVRVVTDNSLGLRKLVVEAASPIKEGTKVVGSSLATFSVDNFFVDNVKAATGLDVTVYAGSVRAATTFVGPNGKDRPVGSEEGDKTVVDRVLNKGTTIDTTKNIFGQDYSAVYLPIKNVDGKAAGMVFVGRPESEIIATADKSINLTFFFIALLMVASIVPSFLIARYIDRNQKA